MLAYDYPLLGLFWTTLWLFVFIAWIMVLVRIVADIFRSDDMGGFAKALWLLFVIFLPYLGAFVYLIARGRQMTARSVADAKAQEEAVRAYVRDVAGTSGTGTAEQIEQLATLRDRGLITDAEFEAGKAKALS